MTRTHTPRLLALPLVAALAVAVGCAPTQQSESDAPAKKSALSDCKPGDLHLFKSGQLTVGTDDPAYAPWFQDDDPSNGKGFESAVTYAIADKLGFDKSDVVWTKVPFNSSYQPGPKKFDFDINQISVTKKRAKAVTFSKPYYAAAQAVVTMKSGDYADASSLADLKSARLGAQVGTTSLEAIKQIDPSHQPRVYNDTNEATKALQNGQIDGLVADLPSAYYITSAVLDHSTIVGQFQPETGQSEEFALLLQKGNPLVSCLNAAIGSLDDDGTLAKIQHRWLSQVTDVPKLS